MNLAPVAWPLARLCRRPGVRRFPYRQRASLLFESQKILDAETPHLLRRSYVMFTSLAYWPGTLAAAAASTVLQRPRLPGAGRGGPMR